MNDWKAEFYQGPYVPSGVVYGNGCSRCHWILPGFDINPPINKMDLYDNKIASMY